MTADGTSAPPWLTIFGTITGLFLLLIPLGVPYVVYVFPVWVTILSVYLLIKDPGGQLHRQTHPSA